MTDSDRDRFYVQQDKHRVFQRLSDRETGPFAYLKDVFVFSAALGFRYERRIPFEGKRQHVGFWDVFSESRDVPTLQAIAIATTGDLSILGDRAEVLAIAEEFANGGIDLVVDLERHDRDATLVSLATEILHVSRDPEGSAA